ncbi:MAG: Elongation factor P [Candidatus Anoxychlamydiales bacterium]|nr:Elongation factor P [Candidatus Anoxychlamydiales bacterium]
MTISNQLIPGMTINITTKIYRVESCIKVSVSKGSPFIKAKLRDLITDEVIEKNFKIDQVLKEVSLVEHKIEYLYPEGKDYLFLDIDDLTQILVRPEILADRINFLKEGIRLKALFYGDSIFAVELPQYLELMVVKTESNKGNKLSVSTSSKQAEVETGAKIEVPLFVEVGDILKIDTTLNEFVQRV